MNSKGHAPSGGLSTRAGQDAICIGDTGGAERREQMGDAACAHRASWLAGQNGAIPNAMAASGCQGRIAACGLAKWGNHV